MKTVDTCGVVKRYGSTISRKNRIVRFLFLFLALLARSALGVDLNQQVPLDIPEGTALGDALLDLFQRARVPYSAPSVASYRAYRSPALRGKYPLGKALDRLLRGTGLTFTVKGDTLWVFKSPENTDPTESESPGPVGAGSDPGSGTRPRQPSDISEVTVLGLYIPDAPLTRPDMSFDKSALEQTGLRTVGDFLRSLPQSFGGGLNLGVIGAGGSQNTPSQSAASTANLRGLGSASTLTLVNGQRIATAEGSGAVDVTLIPLFAVERIDIITSGASAAYGSDAVAGVVNIILKSDYQGLELSGLVGGATQGGDFLHGYSIAVGHTWDKTNVFAARDCSWQQSIDSSQRSYAPIGIAGTTLLPGLEDCSTLLSASRGLSHEFQARAVGIYTQRSVSQADNLNATTPGLAAVTLANVDQYVFNTNIVVPFSRISRTWAGVIDTSVSADKIISPEFLTLNGAPFTREGDRFNDQLRSVDIGASGTVLQIAGSDAKLALGAGVSVEDFLSTNMHAGSFIIATQRRSRFGFAETFVPLLPAVDDATDPQLALDVGVRTQQYNGEWTTTNPKVVLTYTPSPSFAMAASWGTSFSAPALLQQFNISQATLKLIPDANSPSGESLGLFRFGGNPDLQPEEASESTVSFTFSPISLPGLRLRLDYYDIFYTKRIEFPTPNTNDPLSDAAVWPFVIRNPNEAQITQVLSASQLVDLTGGQFTPQEATIIVDDRNKNIARQRATGVDFQGAYARDTAFGRWQYSVNAAYLNLRQQITALTPVMSQSGTAFYPPDWRAQFGMTWLSRSYQASIYANYTGPLSNRDSQPAEAVASWLTFDTQIGYTLHEGGYWGTTRITFSVQNIANRRPPYVATAVNYDSTNASPVGRLLAARATVTL